jgi:uncharacterized membrane protein
VIRDPLALTAIIVGATALAFYLDHRVPALGRIGASLLAIILGAILSNLALVPASSPVYDVVAGPVTSLAIAWLLLSVKLSDVKKAGPRMLRAYGLAVAGTAAGALVGAFLFAGVFGEDTWRLAGVLTGSFTGGSLNFVAVGRSVDLPDRLFAGATAADALLTGLWMGATLILPVWLRRFYPPVPGDPIPSGGGVGVGKGGGLENEAAPAPGAGDASETGHRHPFFLREAISTLDLAVLVAVGVALLLASSFLAALIPGVPAILWLTTLSLGVGQLRGMARPMGAFPLGTLALHFFFVVIGIFSRVSEILAVGLEVFWLVLVVVLVHGVVVYGGGRIARMDLASLSVASQAAVGGPSSALAVAVSREWKSLVLPGIIVGLLGYAIGNYLGVAMAGLVRAMGVGF